MGQEFELKYRAGSSQLEAIQADFSGFREISMETTYFDSPDGALAQRRWTLRQRFENGVSVCTLKTPAENGVRGEWELEWDDIHTAIPQLSKLSGWEELTELTQNGVQPICSARFIRQAALIEYEGATLELALDRGFLRGGVRMELLREVEVELKSGSQEQALAFGRGLAAKYALQTETRSKFKRALALAAQK